MVVILQFALCRCDVKSWKYKIRWLKLKFQGIGVMNIWTSYCISIENKQHNPNVIRFLRQKRLPFDRWNLKQAWNKSKLKSLAWNRCSAWSETNMCQKLVSSIDCKFYMHFNIKHTHAHTHSTKKKNWNISHIMLRHVIFRRNLHDSMRCTRNGSMQSMAFFLYIFTFSWSLMVLIFFRFTKKMVFA